MNRKAYIFIGISGGGKSTQLNLTLEEFKARNKKVTLLCIGNLLKEFAKSLDTSLANKLESGLSSGELVPSFFTVIVWGKRLVEEIDNGDVIIFDGVRMAKESVYVVEAMEYANVDEVVVLHIDTDRDESFKRLLDRKRADDSEEGINRRLDWFEKDVRLSLNYFEEQSLKGGLVKYHKVDGNGSVEDVFARIHKIIFSD